MIMMGIKMQFIIFIIIIFYINICLASGILTFIYRFRNKNHKKNMVNCYCDNCKHVLKFWECNLPIFNYLLLKGKCKYCNKKISVYHPLFEIIIGLMITLIWVI